MVKRNWLSWFIIALVLGAGASLWYKKSAAKEGIFNYEATTDRSFILDQFKKHWYWLISDYSPDYDPAYMLDYRAPTKEPLEKGTLIIKVYRVNNVPVGFITYHEKELLEGYILFLEVDQAHRSKGYARKLMKHAIDDLKQRGMKVIRLITRTDNIPGRKLYTSLGFKQCWTDGAYIKFEMCL